MRKKVNRYFAGAMESQRKWLDRMADEGWRLVGTTVMGYEFEDCEAGKYQYAVEYIGNKSKESAESYALFLQECGYRVFFKNINLNSNIGKLVYKPWAERGGRLASNSTTLNKELLIVEKERDGRPFDLHTSAGDSLASMRAMSRPWIWSAALWLAIAALSRRWAFALIAVPFILVSVIYLIKIAKLKRELRISE